MRRSLALAVLVLPGVGFAPAPSPPSLKLVHRQPPTVQGLHFRKLERVTVTLVAVPREVRHVRATRSGSFVVSFDHAIVSHCGGLAILAKGAKGSVAMLKVPRFACSAV